jgi:peroxiredoxin
MEAYRDQYATIFNNGRNVTVIGISVDADTTLNSWAREKDFPIVFASDAGGRVGAAYGAFDSTRKQDTRFLYVIGPDGKIAYTAKPFRVLTEQSYKDLGEAIHKLAPVAKDSAQ